MTDPIPFEPDSSDLIRDYVKTVRAILLTPSRFFREMPLGGGISRPLAFALVTHWIGSAFGYLWGTMAGHGLEKMVSHIRFTGMGDDVDSAAKFTQWMEIQQKASHWFWQWFVGAGSIILDPFKTLVMVFVTAGFIYVAARLFVTSSRQPEITYESSVRLVSYGVTPAIIAAFPFVGSFAAGIYVMVVTIIGAREAYRTSNRRAVLIVLFPYLLFVGIIAMGFLLLAFAALKFAVSVI